MENLTPERREALRKSLNEYYKYTEAMALKESKERENEKESSGCLMEILMIIATIIGSIIGESC